MPMHIGFEDGTSVVVAEAASSEAGITYTNADGDSVLATWAEIRVIREADPDEPR